MLIRAWVNIILAESLRTCIPQARNACPRCWIKTRLSKNAVFGPNSLSGFWTRPFCPGMPILAGFWTPMRRPKKWARPIGRFGQPNPAPTGLCFASSCVTSPLLTQSSILSCDSFRRFSLLCVFEVFVQKPVVTTQMFKNVWIAR